MPDRSLPGRAQLAALRALALDRQAAETLEALAGAGIEARLMKGAALAQLLYDGDEARGYQDVDVLVDPGRWEAARAVLAGLGYRCTLTLAEMPIPRSDHAEHWTREGAAGDVDLHMTLPEATVEESKAWAVLSADPRTIDVGGRAVPTTGLAATAMHVALHATQHGVQAGKPLRDLELAVARLPRATWEGAADLAAELGAADSFAAGLSLVPAGRSLAAELSLVERSSLDLVLKTSSATKTTRTLAALGDAPSSGAALRIAAVRMFPKAAYMRKRYPLARRGHAGLALCYAVRPLEIAGKLGPALLALRRARRAVR